MLFNAKLLGDMAGHGLAEPVRLVRVRVDHEPEVIDEWTIKPFPVSAPYVTVVDFNQALSGHLCQVGFERVGVSDNNGFTVASSGSRQR